MSYLFIETYKPNCGVNTPSRSVDKSLKIIGSGSQMTSKNSIISSLSTDTSADFHEDPFSGFYVKLLKDKETD